ncbi:class C sortase [Bifidobacterium saguini]|nr:class C sortase [Bifidobacterium saguini]QTB90703.1 class C sortase [Bifidobacterium saguini]
MNARRQRTMLGIALLLCASLCATLPPAFMLANGHTDQRLADTHNQATLALADKTSRAEWEKAREYNTLLAADGPSRQTETTDPWNDGTDPGDDDETYRSLLSTPADGIMSTIDYPRLGINLPIRHGTGAATLAAGAGHLYGTSLPVGGTSTRTVISAHTGLADRLLFDRISLRQAREGDIFYITTLGRTLAYQVETISIVDPDDTSGIRIQEGRDLATLLTCTPYGVNNQRILVTGHRTGMPDPAPEPGNAPRSHAWIIPIMWITAVQAATITTITVVIRRRTAGGKRGRGQHARH